jgi:hypothetical protein
MMFVSSFTKIGRLEPVIYEVGILEHINSIDFGLVTLFIEVLPLFFFTLLLICKIPAEDDTCDVSACQNALNSLF